MAGKKEAPLPSRLEVLRENELLLRTALAGADPANVASIARELRATVAEVAELEAAFAPEESIVDKLAAKRAARLAAVNPAPAERRGQPRRRGGEHRAG